MAAIIEAAGNEIEQQTVRNSYCEQHGQRIGSSGLCDECEFEVDGERCREDGVILNPDGSCTECEAKWEARAREKGAWCEAEVEQAASKSQCSTLEFPRHALVGS